MSSLLLSLSETNRLGPDLFPLLSTKRRFHQHPESSIVSRTNHSFHYCHRHSRRRSIQVQGRKIKVWPDVFVQNQVETSRTEESLTAPREIFPPASAYSTFITHIHLFNLFTHFLFILHSLIIISHHQSHQTSQIKIRDVQQTRGSLTKHSLPIPATRFSAGEKSRKH